MGRIGWVGLGVMGAPMAGHLLQGGYDLTVWNRTESKADPLLQQGARRAESLQELAKTCEIIFLCVSRTEDVQQCIGKLSETAKPSTLFVDHSTILPKAAKEIYQQLKERGIGFVDAPLTGGSMGAQKGQLTIFCGGEQADVEKAMPMLSCYAKRAARTGGPGTGQLTKMANQIAVAASVLGLCESMSFAEKVGLDLAFTRELLAGGAAGSWSFDNYGPKLLARDWSPGFKVKDQLKDLKYCIETAKQADASVPGTILMDRLLAEAELEGLGEKTTAVLFELLLNESFSN